MKNENRNFVGVFNGVSVFNDLDPINDDGYYYNLVLADGTVVGEVYDGWLEWVADGWEILGKC